jgi:hypothetical protein
MNDDMLVMITGLSFLVSVGIFCAQEHGATPPRNHLSDESKWLDYPKAEHMFTLEEIQARTTPPACKALKEHQRNQPTSFGETEAPSSPAKLWKMKHDELYTQCSIETIEQTITRLQEQLKKDREQLKQAQAEYVITAE